MVFVLRYVIVDTYGIGGENQNIAKRINELYSIDSVSASYYNKYAIKQTVVCLPGGIMPMVV